MREFGYQGERVAEGFSGRFPALHNWLAVRNLG